MAAGPTPTWHRLRIPVRNSVEQVAGGAGGRVERTWGWRRKYRHWWKMDAGLESVTSLADAIQ